MNQDELNQSELIQQGLKLILQALRSSSQKQQNDSFANFDSEIQQLNHKIQSLEAELRHLKIILGEHFPKLTFIDNHYLKDTFETISNSEASIVQEYLNNDTGCISKYQAIKLAVPFDYQADLTTGKAKSIKLEENPGYQYIAIPNPRGNNYLLLPLTQNYSEQPIQSSGLKYVYEFQLASEHRNHIADIPVPALASKDHQGNWILLERGQLIFQD